MSLFSILLIGIGWYIEILNLAVAGAIVMLVGGLGGLIYLIVKSKQFKVDESAKIPIFSIDKFSQIIEVILLVGSLLAMIPERELYRLPGQIIWIGHVATFAFFGPIVESFANIPMRMTYGGWNIRRPRRKRKF